MNNFGICYFLQLLMFSIKHSIAEDCKYICVDEVISQYSVSRLSFVDWAGSCIEKSTYLGSVQICMILFPKFA